MIKRYDTTLNCLLYKLDLDDTTSHPFFTRTIPSDAATAEAIADLLSFLSYEQVSVLYHDDVYGRSVKDTLFDTTSILGIELSLFPFQPEFSSSIEQALKDLKSTDLNIVVAVFFSSDIPKVMREASSLGVTGKDKLWIFTDSVQFVDLDIDGDPKVAAALNGSLQVQPSGGTERAEYEAFVAAFSRFSAFERLQHILPGSSESIDAFPEFNLANNISREFYEQLGPSLFR